MTAGDVLDGRYELVRQIGAGGMGTVWEARDVASGRRVALKTLHEHLMSNEALVARFLREAHAAVEAQFSGHIIEVLDVVQPPGRPPYLVMEHLEGEDLEQILEREGRLEPTRAVDLAIQSCHAVAEVHRQGLVHRDIKPENLFVTRLPDGSEWIKLLDFGVVKFSDAARAPRITSEGLTVGTPHYMAPEQASAPERVDHRVDIYALGVVLYELLTGEAPYDAEDTRDVMRMHLRGKPTPPRRRRPEIAPELEAVVLRAMAPSPRKRFQTVYELAEALEPFGSSAPPAGARSAIAALSTVNESLPEQVRDELEAGRRRRRLVIIALVGAAAGSSALALLLGLAMCSAGRGRDETGAASTDGVAILFDAGAEAETDHGEEDATPPTGEDGARSGAARWAKRYAAKVDRRALARGLRRIGPGVRACLRGSYPSGTKMILHFWIAPDGTILYRRARPPLSPATSRCLKRAARAHKLPATRVPAFVAVQRYRVP